MSKLYDHFLYNHQISNKMYMNENVFVVFIDTPLIYFSYHL